MDLKAIYQVPYEEMALEALDTLEETCLVVCNNH